MLQRRLKGLGPEDRVFTDKSGKYTNYKIVARMSRAVKDAGLPYGDKLLNRKGERVGLTFHSLRHYRVTAWIKAGFSDEIIRMASGHLDLSSYRNYIHLDSSDVIRLVSKPGKTGTKTAESLY